MRIKYIHWKIILLFKKLKFTRGDNSPRAPQLQTAHTLTPKNTKHFKIKFFII